MMQSEIKIAITGGIGSGKSTVGDIIKSFGYSVFSCDLIYSELLKDKSYLEKLSLEFGDILLPDGSLNRKLLSMIVFSDKDKLTKLNELTHTEIMRAALNKMKGYRLSFCEVPLLFENGFERYFDNVIVVLRDKAERLLSVTKRNNISFLEAEKRVNSQYDYDNNDFAKYYVIHNSGNLTLLDSKTEEILKKIKEDYF